MRQLTDADFAQVVNEKSGLVLVAFTATWCAPCRALTPVLEQLEKTYAGKLTVAQLDVDAGPGTRERNNVKSVPCLLLFKQDKRVSSWLGFHAADELQGELATHLA